MTRLHACGKALSPVAAAIILIVASAVISLAAGMWMGAISFNYIEVEEIHIADHAWALDNSYVDLIIQNKGTKTFSLASISVNGETAVNITIVNGTPTLGAGDTCTIRIPYNFVNGSNYCFNVKTATGKSTTIELECPK